MLDKFLEISYNSRKWEKWMIKNSNASNFDKSVISGHYIFSNPDFINLKKELEFELKKKSINLDTFLKNEVKKNILRYLINFRMI